MSRSLPPVSFIAPQAPVPVLHATDPYNPSVAVSPNACFPLNRLQNIDSEEVAEGLLDAILHGLLTLADL